jgi:hypothetical protein
MTIWWRYHLIYFAGPLLSLLISYFLSLIGYVIVGTIVFVCGSLFCFILCLKVVCCPHCKTSLSASVNMFSKHYTGYKLLVPKKCVNCGYELKLRKSGF